MKKIKALLSLLLSFSLAIPSTAVSTIAAQKYAEGVTVEANTNEEYAAPYQVTFVYKDESIKNAVSVTVSGNFQFYSKDDEVVKNYTSTSSAEGATIYDVYEYQDGMFNTGYGLNGDMKVYEMEEIKNETFQITLPVPGNLYYYDYTVTYQDGTTVTMQDPANPSPANPANGHDAGHSLVYVGSKDNTTKGQEYIYPRTDGQTGTYEFIPYTAVDGTTQYVEVYTPYGYTKDEQLPTIYVSHGGGGQEAEWMSIGAIPNIMDNLIAEGLTEKAVVVTMDNTYFGWDYPTINDNLMNYIMPVIEEQYNVSTSPEDRAFCGLSMGGFTTTNVYIALADQFKYFGPWSATDGNLTRASVENGDYPVIMFGCGCVDFAVWSYYGNATAPGVIKTFGDNNEDYLMYLSNGAHDWGVWRDLFTTFAKDVLWQANEEEHPAGVTVDGNEVTFTYVDKNFSDIESVTVAGNLQWYSPDCIEQDENGMNITPNAQSVDAYHYEEGMINTGYGVNGDGQVYTLEETSKGHYEITLTLPGNLYYYDYTITYADGTVEKIKDPANLSDFNPANGYDAGHSLVYVGSKDNCTPGQEYIYPRTDGQVGTREYVAYTAIDGSTQYLEIYLPYGYDSSKTYKTLYVSHGGGGNEAEWMTIGALANIMDNLIAEGELEPTVAVTMNNSYFKFAKDDSINNFEQCIFPTVEAYASVSTDPQDRAICGLSAGGMTTGYFIAYDNEAFGYYGVWSPTNSILPAAVENGEVTEEDLAAFNHAVYMIGVGSMDNVARQTSEKKINAILTEAGCNSSFTYSPGAHDWGVWRDLLTQFAKDYIWQPVEIEVNGTQTIEIIGEEWGPAVHKTTITLDKPIDAIDIENITITENKEALNWSTMEFITSTTERTITDVQLSEDGKTITVEMAYDSGVGSPFIYDVPSGGYNRWCKFYEQEITITDVTVKGTTAAIQIAKEIDLEDEEQTIIPQMENVTKNIYKATDGTQLSYGEYTPAQDNGKNPLVIWLHGSGEGGTDPIVPILGNEVTELFSEEFQTTMGGAYVLVPQSPTKWSDPGIEGTVYCTGHAQYTGDVECDSIYIDALCELIREYVANNPDVDPTRILIGGCSNGGYMTTRVLLEMHDFFAGAYLNSESYKDAYLTDEFIQTLKDDQIGLWYIYDINDNVAEASVPTTARLEGKENYHVSVYEAVIGNYEKPEGGYNKYSDHWAWVYFFNNEVADGELTAWQWMAQQQRTTNQFTDVSADKWYASYVEEAYKLGIMTGTSETTFAPNKTLTRGMVVTMLYRMAGEPEVEYTGKFADVAEGKYYSLAVEWAAANGIVNGYKTGNFGPSDHITRQDFAVMLRNYAKFCGVDVTCDVDLTAYPDAGEVSAYALSAVQWAVANGIITGDQGKINPKALTKRSQAAKMIVVANSIIG